MKTYCIIFNEGEKDSLESALKVEMTRLDELIEKITDADVLDDDAFEIEQKIQNAIAEHVEEAVKKVRARAERSAAAPDTKPTVAVPTPPPAPVSDPEPEPAEDVCAVCRKDPHAKWCTGNEPAKEAEPIPGETAPAHACCGSKAKWRHKVSCPTLKAEAPTATAEAKPDEGEETEEEDEEEEPKTKAAPADDENIHLICKKCGNPREEPHGTNPLLLFCPNGFGDDGDEHIYELKSDD